MIKLMHLLKEYVANDFSTVEDVLALNVLIDFEKETLADMENDFSKKLVSKYKTTSQSLYKRLKPYLKAKLPPAFVRHIDQSWYDGSDAYDSVEMQERHLPRIYDNQIKVIEALLKELEKTAKNKKS